MGYDEPSSKRSAALAREPGEARVTTAPQRVRTAKRSPRTILVALVLLIGAGYAAYQFGLPSAFTSSGRQAGRPPQAAPVRVATASRGDIPVIVRTIGTVLANSVVTVKSQVDGPLLSANFKEGQMVHKGDLLFRIDPAPFEAALRQAQAQVERDQAQLVSAQADADRAVMLAERGIVSAQQRDQLVATAKALAASIAADKAAVDKAQLQLSYTTISSPIDGKTGPYIVYPGNQVHANDAAGLITITQIQPVKISFDLPQTDLPQLQDRMGEGDLVAGVTIRKDVAATVANATDTPSAEMEIPVKVDFIGNEVDARTGTVELRATFDNPDLRLVPGELVDVAVRLQTLKNTITVPRDALNVGQDGDYVYVVDSDAKAMTRPVKVLYQDQQIAALASGVQPGERVVTDGQLRLSPGAKVAVVGNPGANGGQRGAGNNTARAQANGKAGRTTR
jgi:membrane fusion protein, multidrug efflux system